MNLGIYGTGGFGKEVFEDENAKKLVRSEQIVDKETKRVTSIAFEWE